MIWHDGIVAVWAWLSTSSPEKLLGAIALLMGVFRYQSRKENKQTLTALNGGLLARVTAIENSMAEQRNTMTEMQAQIATLLRRRTASDDTQRHAKERRRSSSDGRTA